MDSFYKSYVHAFVKFAESVADSRLVKTLSMYAIIISNKANELIKRAALNTKIDLANLKKEIYESGKLFIHKFEEAIKLKNSKEVNRH